FPAVPPLRRSPYRLGRQERQSDVVHPRARLLGLAAGDVRDRRRAEHLAEGFDALGPDAAGLLALLPQAAVQRLDDLQDVDLLRGPGQRVAALDAAVALEEAVAAEGREELLEELDGHRPALRNLGDRDRAIARSGELGHRDDGVAGLRSDRDHSVVVSDTAAKTKHSLFPGSRWRPPAGAARMAAGRCPGRSDSRWMLVCLDAERGWSEERERRPALPCNRSATHRSARRARGPRKSLRGGGGRDRLLRTGAPDVG